MRISITNFRGCRSAAVTGSPLLIVGGRNGNGKSSLLQGVALAVTQWVVPAGVTKKNAGDLIYRDKKLKRASKAEVAVTLEAGSAYATYPDASSRLDGDLKVTPVAAGLIRLPELAPDALAKALSGVVPSVPVLEDLLAAFQEVEIDAKTAGIVWKKIQEVGWDGALAQAQERGKSVKAEWRAVTGRNWGTSIGETWTPEGWDDSLLADETSDADIADLYAALREAEKAAAYDEGTKAAMREEIEALAQREKDAAAATAEEQAALEALRQAENRLSTLPRPQESGMELPCPHCGGFLRLDRTSAAAVQLVKAEESTNKAADIERMRRDIAAAEGELANKRTAYTNAKAKAFQALTSLSRSKDAAAKIDDANKASGGQGDIEAAQKALDDAKSRVAKRDSYGLAVHHHNTIVGNAKIQDILAPSGLRATVLKRGLDAFNKEHLAPLCGLAGWPEVSISEDLVVSYGETAWWELSGAEQWITSAILQIAVARADGSHMVILDGADICDAGNRNALFSVLPEIGIEALVGMTFNKPEQLPDLSAAGLGARFWMRDGVSEAIG